MPGRLGLKFTAATDLFFASKHKPFAIGGNGVPFGLDEQVVYWWRQYSSIKTKHFTIAERIGTLS